MSIFKSTLKPEIASQLKAREKVISSDSRGSDFLLYTTGKNSWVRMTSLVDYDAKKFENGKLVKDVKYSYSGDQLSRKYVLEGGTLYSSNANTFKLRSGVGKADSIYASDIDKINASPTDNKVDRMYGLRPMPGITSVNISSKSAYGSLREAVVNFYCWDKHQLEELEILFMRTGYTVLLEWGWSQYIDHDNANNINDYPNLKGIKPYDKAPVNAFGSLTDQDIYDKIDKTVEDTKGNFDALLGYVKNFSWQLMPNGGFQCNTTLISRGETIEGIKASSNPNIILGSYEEPNTALTPAESEKPMYSNFEKIFLNIIGHINEAEFVESYTYGSNNEQGQLFVSGSAPEGRKALRDQADKIYSDINTRLSKSIQSYIDGTWDNYNVKNNGTINLDNNLLVKASDGATEGIGIEYISLNAFIAILNEFFIYRNAKTQKQVINIVLPYSTPCLATEDSVSIDPTTCLIQNAKATFITNLDKGFSPQVFTNFDTPSLTSNAINYITSIKSEFLASGTTNIGQIGNIFVSINKIINTYRGLSGGTNGVDVIDLLQNILDDCSFALGGINDFKLYSNRNIIQVIDAKYFENATKESKFKFDLIGLKSICRDVKINSRIFSEQSTMIAIGAGTSGGNTGNLGDVYASTQNYFNRGLKDRVISSVTFEDPNQSTYQVGNTILSGSELYYFNIFKNIDSLSNYIYNYVLGKEINTYNVTKIPQSNQVVNAGSLLKTCHYQLNGKDVDFKALIPFELEITLDGIGGLVIGQIFTIDKSILPRDYYNKNLGFIITGIAHTLQNNDWLTVIKTQICLLENDKISDNEGYTIDKSKLKDIVKKAQISQAQNGYLLCAIADYLVNALQYTLASRYGKRERASDSFNVTSINYLNGNIETFKKLPAFITDLANDIDSVKSTKRIEGYLKAWYDEAKKLNPPNFPASYDEFVKPSGNTSVTPEGLYDAISNIIINKNKADAYKKYEAVIAKDPSDTSVSEADSKIIFENTFLQYGLSATPGASSYNIILNKQQSDQEWKTKINRISGGIKLPFFDAINAGIIDRDVEISTLDSINGTGFHQYYTLPKNAFDTAFLLFYNVAQNFATNDPRFTYFSGPNLGGDTNYKKGSFSVVRFEKPIQEIKGKDIVNVGNDVAL